MKTRVLAGLIMAPLLVVLYFGGYALLAACFLIAVLGVREFYKGFESMGIKPSYPIACVSAVLLYGFNLIDQNVNFIMPWFFISVLMCLLYLFKIQKRKLEDAMATLIGILYVVFFSYHVVLVDQMGSYRIFLWLIVISAFGTDIMAYFTGYLLGKHKLCPNISPKKTIEGAVGGVLGSVILCGLYGYFFTDGLLVQCLIIGMLGSIFSQLGDLTASIFKRKMGVKDYGNLIPGHGGILDRFDSVLFTAPLVYYYIYIKFFVITAIFGGWGLLS